MMKKIFGELINFFTASLLIICLLASGYLIFANIYHTKMLFYKYNFTQTDIDEQKRYVSTVDTAIKLNDELDFVNLPNIDARQYYKYINLAMQKCLTIYKNSKYYQVTDGITAKDNYDLYSDFSKAHNECFNYQLSTIVDMTSKSEYKDDTVDSYLREFNKTAHVIASTTDLTQSVLYGNSSYQFYTMETINTIYNQNKSIFYQLRTNYQDEVDMVNSLVTYLDSVAKGAANEKDS